MADESFHHLNPMKCSICGRGFMYLQDDYPPSLHISRCMECYGQRFGLEHLATYLRELGDHPHIDIPLEFFWEHPISDPIVKEALEERGYKLESATIDYLGTSEKVNIDKDNKKDGGYSRPIAVSA